MTTLDIITIVLFSLGVVLVGLAFSRKGKSMQSFFAANGTMPWYMSGLSLFMGFSLPAHSSYGVLLLIPWAGCQSLSNGQWQLPVSL